MCNPRTQQVRRRTSRPLSVELLEERQVLSLLGLLPTAATALVSTVSQVVPDQAAVSVVSQSPATGTTTDPQIGSAYAADMSVPISTALSVLDNLVDGILDVHVQPASAGVSPEAQDSQPGPSTSASPSQANLSLQIVGVKLGLGLTSENDERTEPSVNDGEGEPQPIITDTIANPLDIEINLGATEPTDVAAIEPTLSAPPATSGPVNSGITLGVIPQADAGSGNRLIVASLPASSAPAKTFVVPTTSSSTVVAPAAPDASRGLSANAGAASISSSLAANPVPSLNPLAAGVALPSQLADFALRLPLSTDTYEPSVPALSRSAATLGPLDAGAEPIVDFGRLTTEASGLLANATPFDLADMDRALQDFLDQFDDLRDNLGVWFSATGAAPWVLMAFAVGVTMHELLRRRKVEPFEASDFAAHEHGARPPRA